MAQQSTKMIGEEISSLRREEPMLTQQLSDIEKQRREAGQKYTSEAQGLREFGAAAEKAALEKFAKERGETETKFDDLRRNLAFEPTKENMADLSQLFGIMTIATFTLGGAGRQSGMGALSALTGAMEGYRKGRKDIYERELKEFDKRLREVQMYNDNVERARKSALETLVSNRDLGMAEAKRYQMMLQGTKEAYDVAKGNFESANRSADARLKANQSMQRELMRMLSAKEDRAASLAASAARVAPTPIYVKTPEGQTVAFDARAMKVDPATGQFQLPQGYSIVGGKGLTQTKAGQNALTFASRVFGNIQNASQDLELISALSEDSKVPFLQGIINKDQDTVLGSIKAYGSTLITPAQQRIFDQISGQVSAALSRLEAQGLASGSTAGTIKSFDSLKPKNGDNFATMAIYLAKAKQEIVTGISVLEEMPGATDGQIKKAKAQLATLDKLIPFTTRDVVNVMRRDKQTLTDKAVRILNLPSITNNLEYKGSKPLESGEEQTEPSPTTAAPSTAPSAGSWRVVR